MATFQELPANIDLSVNPGLIGQAKSLLGPKVTPDFAASWIHNSEKKRRERIFLGFFGSLLSIGPALVAASAILVSDGRPVRFNLPVDSIGIDGTETNPAITRKFRTLRRGIRPEETPLLESSALITPQLIANKVPDNRSHSWVGEKLRKTSLDEIPQVWAVLRGEMAGIGVRGYYQAEQRDIRFLFDHHPEKLPLEVRTNYRQTVARIRPDCAFMGLYTATRRKVLTVSERLLLDLIYMQGANPAGDWNIFRATLHTYRRGTGAR